MEQLAMVGILSFLLGATLIWVLRGGIERSRSNRILKLESQAELLDGKAKELDTAREAITELTKAVAAANAKLESLAAAEFELSEARALVTSLTAQNASLMARMDAETAAHGAQISQLTQLRDNMQDQFKLLAGDVFRTNSEDFAKRAEELFRLQKEQTVQEIDERSEKLSGLIKPLEESLRSYDEEVKKIELERVAGFARIDTTLIEINKQNDEVRMATSNLVSALRTSPKTVGRWGEEQLRRVMEMSGMMLHCDFEVEKHFPGEDESVRPDAVISVAGGRTIIVDAKTPVKAYIEATQAANDEEREALLNKHAQQVRTQLSNLSKKSYQDKIVGSADCVVMFVPGDNFVAAAFQRDPAIFQDAIDNRVLICTPTTFIGLAKALAYGWRQEKLAESAIAVAKLGRELYSRLATMGGHIADLGKHIENSARKYNLLVGSLENSVMPQARRFTELGVEGTAQALPEMTTADTVVRFPQPGRDLLVSSNKQES